jgi:exosortase/archaeosortase family protein
LKTKTQSVADSSNISPQERNLSDSPILPLVLLITLGAIAADQLVAPVLHSSSPLWAAAACLLLVWRRDGLRFKREAGEIGFGFSFLRIGLFSVAHLALVSAALAVRGALGPISGTLSFSGWIIAALKLSVLLPTLLLLPLGRWRILARAYAAEGIAGLVVLFTFFPIRVLATVWPWYGQVLGRFVFYFARLLAPGLTYASGFSPTIQGPELDVTILPACSGIDGIELFDYLFAFVALLDWNRLRKGRTLMAYFVGVAAVLLGNALRISSFVIFGNRGFADGVARFHLSAGWLFFSAVFLAYLAAIYRKLLVNPEHIVAKLPHHPHTS